MHPALHALGYKHVRLAESRKQGVYSKQPFEDIATRTLAHLHLCRAHVPGWPALCVATAHLRAGKNESDIRLEQASDVIQVLSNHAHVLFGGDVNTRIEEDKKLAPELKSSGSKDVFLAVDEPEHHRFTWDTRVNETSGYKPGVHARFDQIWFRGDIVPIDLRLIDTETFEVNGRCVHPSDHFGILAWFAPGSDLDRD
eukprot:TRINITY_DN12617_c2_g7_i1.p1 TRINITY_DN12617_c2_g7~~TRINITY_DN12617_c2_g7_i1.p1  ORF type:complete len:198 (+),score=29.95 TRINITY_DN12617_c2_g7_i1:506-1099(+)